MGFQRIFSLKKSVIIAGVVVICSVLLHTGQIFAVTDVLVVTVDDESVYVRPGEPVISGLFVFFLDQKVNACQAVMEYDTTFFSDPVGGCITAGGGPWDLVIWDSWKDTAGIPGKIDAAIGVDALGAFGTDENRFVAKITLVTSGVEGITQILFRPDISDVESTFFADVLANAVTPEWKVGSRFIYIDGTPPLVNIIAAEQNGNQLLGPGAPSAVQGDVTITVAASNILAGLTAIPSVSVTPQGGPPQDITSTGLNNGDGTFSYTYTITPTTLNGLAAINTGAVDKSGNSASDSETFRIKKLWTGTLRIISVKNGSAHLEWSPAGSYYLQYSATPGFESLLGNVIVDDTITEYFYNVGTAGRGFFRLVPR